MIKISNRKLIGGQAGFTLAEMVVAIAISAIVVMGSLIILRFTIFAAADNQDKTLASLEVQYVGFWISEDVMQAQHIILDYGETECVDPPDCGPNDCIPPECDPNDGFPLYLRWHDYKGEGTEGLNTVIYEVEEMEDQFGEILWRLYRTHEVGGVSLGTALVGEYLVPGEAYVPGETYCERRDHHTEDLEKFSSSLLLYVAADVDRSEAENSYEIYPRAFCTWDENAVDDL